MTYDTSKFNILEPFIINCLFYHAPFCSVPDNYQSVVFNFILFISSSLSFGSLNPLAIFSMLVLNIALKVVAVFATLSIDRPTAIAFTFAFQSIY